MPKEYASRKKKMWIGEMAFMLSIIFAIMSGGLLAYAVVFPTVKGTVPILLSIFLPSTSLIYVLNHSFSKRSKVQPYRLHVEDDAAFIARVIQQFEAVQVRENVWYSFVKKHGVRIRFLMQRCNHYPHPSISKERQRINQKINRSRHDTQWVTWDEAGKTLRVNFLVTQQAEEDAIVDAMKQAKRYLAERVESIVNIYYVEGSCTLYIPAFFDLLGFAEQKKYHIIVEILCQAVRSN